MRIIGETNFQFLKHRTVALSISLLIILAGLGYEYMGAGLNLGIDFVGGTQVTIKFKDAPDLDRLRDTLTRLDVGSPLVQRFDEEEKHEILIRVQNPSDEEGDFTKPILDLLYSEYNQDVGDRFDLNTKGTIELTDLLAQQNPDGVTGDKVTLEQHYSPMADAVSEYRKKQGLFKSVDELAGIEALSEPVRTYLGSTATSGAFTLLGAENVGPSVGKDLRSKAVYAIIYSLIGMLAYIWIRFQLPYGLGAVAALFHDVLITVSALSLTGREVNLPTVAAILTLVGYSVNDTVVVFDRVRENLRLRRGEELEELMNRSVNQTLSRTLITSGTTLLVVLTLFIFGGDVINTFAFVLLVGIIVGTYSSVFVASPVALFASRMVTRRRKARMAR